MPHTILTRKYADDVAPSTQITRKSTAWLVAIVGFNVEAVFISATTSAIFERNVAGSAAYDVSANPVDGLTFTASHELAVVSMLVYDARFNAIGPELRTTVHIPRLSYIADEPVTAVGVGRQF